MDNKLQIARHRFLQEKSPDNELAYIIALQRAGIMVCPLELDWRVFKVKGELDTNNRSFIMPEIHPCLRLHKERKYYHLSLQKFGSGDTHLRVLKDENLCLTVFLDFGNEVFNYSLETFYPSTAKVCLSLGRISKDTRVVFKLTVGEGVVL